MIPFVAAEKVAGEFVNRVEVEAAEVVSGAAAVSSNSMVSISEGLRAVTEVVLESLLSFRDGDGDGGDGLSVVISFKKTGKDIFS